MSEEIKEPELSESREYTEEEKQQLNDFYVMMFKTKFKNPLKQIGAYMASKNITIEEAIEEVNNKTSGLSRICREILMYVNLEVLKKCFAV